MRALTVGEVIESSAPEFRAGEFVYGWFGWQIYCVATPDAVLRRVQPSALPLSANLSLLGINGLTAYLALHGLGDPKARRSCAGIHRGRQRGQFCRATRADRGVPRCRIDQLG
jgi:NADPH-dependent curcumin reductase CurA